MPCHLTGTQQCEHCYLAVDRGKAVVPTPSSMLHKAESSTTGKVVSLLVLAATVLADDNSTGSFKAFEGVDPNTLECDPAGQIFLLLPHYSYCSKFFMCAHGEEVEFNCPGGLIFDFELQTCNWDWAVECQLRTPKDEAEGSGDETADGLIGHFADVLEQQPVDTIASVRPISPLLSRFNGIINCNRADAAARQVPYRGDCQRYWRCVAGVPQVAYCSDGLFFNEFSQQCDFEANARCTIEPEGAADELQGEFLLSN